MSNNIDRLLRIVDSGVGSWDTDSNKWEVDLQSLEEALRLIAEELRWLRGDLVSLRGEDLTYEDLVNSCPDGMWGDNDGDEL